MSIKNTSVVMMGGNGACMAALENTENDNPYFSVVMDSEPSDEGMLFDEAECREAARFFTRLADELKSR